MHAYVTGAAGFIGSNLVDELLSRGDKVVGFDNFATGRPAFLEQASKHSNFRFIEGDLKNPAAVTASMRGTNIIYHMAANADVRFGTEHPRRDLEQNVIATHNVLEAMRLSGVRRLAFS